MDANMILDFRGCALICFRLHLVCCQQKALRSAALYSWHTQTHVERPFLMIGPIKSSTVELHSVRRLCVERSGNRDNGEYGQCAHRSRMCASCLRAFFSVQNWKTCLRSRTKWVEPRKRGEHDRIGSKSSLYRTFFSGNKHTHTEFKNRVALHARSSVLRQRSASTHSPSWARTTGSVGDKDHVDTNSASFA